MADTKYYCFCDKGCKFETLTKEQIYAAITQAANDGGIGDVDTGFITTIKTINGTPLKFFVGAQSEFELLTEDQKQNLFAIITNDVTKDGLLEMISRVSDEISGLETSLVDGTVVVKNTKNTDFTNAIWTESISSAAFPMDTFVQEEGTYQFVYTARDQTRTAILYWDGKSNANISLSFEVKEVSGSYCIVNEILDIFYNGLISLSEITRKISGELISSERIHEFQFRKIR